MFLFSSFILIILLMEIFILPFFFLCVHDVPAADGVEYEGEEAHGETQQHAGQHRVALPHVS